MSHIASYSPELSLLDQDYAATLPVRGYKARPRFIPALYVAPALLAGLSWMMGGKPFMTDLAFLLLACLCGFFAVMELINFPRRFGVGGLVLFGGSLFWFC